MAIRKPKPKAKIELSEGAAQEFEATLRRGLVASGAWGAAEADAVKAYGKVGLDAKRVASFARHLRQRMAASKGKKASKAGTKGSSKKR